MECSCRCILIIALLDAPWIIYKYTISASCIRLSSIYYSECSNQHAWFIPVQNMCVDKWIIHNCWNCDSNIWKNYFFASIKNCADSASVVCERETNAYIKVTIYIYTHNYTGSENVKTCSAIQTNFYSHPISVFSLVCVLFCASEQLFCKWCKVTSVYKIF